MASSRRKAAAVALAVVGIAGLSLASAAQLNITSNSLGAGSVDVGACDPDNINVGYTVATGANTVTAVVLTGVADACLGDPFSLQLEQGLVGSQTALGAQVTGSVAASTAAADNNTVTIPLGAGNAQLVQAITGVAIVIS